MCLFFSLIHADIDGFQFYSPKASASGVETPGGFVKSVLRMKQIPRMRRAELTLHHLCGTFATLVDEEVKLSSNLILLDPYRLVNWISPAITKCQSRRERG